MSQVKSHKVRKSVELSSDSLTWFYKEFGDDASLSWYLGLLFNKARDIHESMESIYTPAAIALESAKDVKEIENEN